jgi:anti-sigma factor RsiW
MTTGLVCRDGVDMLMDYLEGTLSPADREAVETHVQGCPRCVAFTESYRQTPRILRAATVAALPDDLKQSLRAVLAARRSRAGS